MSKTGRYHGRIFLGLLLILIGMVFLLGSLDKLDVGEVFAGYWPLILVFFGVGHIFSHGFRDMGFGVLLTLIGVFFMLVKWDVLGWNAWSILWPLLIVAAGIWILFKPRFRDHQGRAPEVGEDDLRTTAFFSGLKRRVQSKAFRGGKATAVFGSAELDFTQAELAGQEATVDLSTVFGSFEIRVPKEWKVVVASSTIFGSVEDKHGPVPEQTKGTLFIRASTIFGSVEILS